MHKTILLIAMILAWINFFFGMYVRFSQMPKWIQSPPTSFNLFGTEATRTKFFWESISFLFLIAAVIGLVLNWNHEDARSHIIASLIFFLLAIVMNFVYYMKKRLAAAQLPLDESQETVMVNRIRSWMRWTLVRDLLVFIAAGFISIAWNHV
jgi:hypothetical protein